MKNTIHNSNRNTEIIYSNRFGSVFSENFTIHPHKNRVVHLDDNLRKVKLVKQRQYKKNVLLFSTAIVMVFFLYFNKVDKPAFIIMGVLTILMMLLSMIIADYHFKFIVLRKYDSTEYIIDGSYSDDAQIVALLVNKKIRNNQNI